MIIDGRQIDETLNLDFDDDPFTVADLIEWVRAKERERNFQSVAQLKNEVEARDDDSNWIDGVWDGLDQAQEAIRKVEEE